MVDPVHYFHSQIVANETLSRIADVVPIGNILLRISGIEQTAFFYLLDKIASGAYVEDVLHEIRKLRFEETPSCSALKSLGLSLPASYPVPATNSYSHTQRYSQSLQAIIE